MRDLKCRDIIDGRALNAIDENESAMVYWLGKGLTFCGKLLVYALVA